MNKVIQKIFWCFAVLLMVVFATAGRVMAQEFDHQICSNDPQIVKAKVIEIIEEDTEQVAGQEAPYQLLRLQLLDSQFQNQQILIEHGGLPVAQFECYDLENEVYLNFNQPLSTLDLSDVLSNQQVAVAGFAREKQLLLLLTIFVFLVLLVNGWKGLRSLFSLLLSFVVIFKIALPILLQGVDPSLVAMVLAIFIIPLTFYLTHGFKRKTHVAVVATIIALTISSLLAVTLINTTNLSGLATEEAAFLNFEKNELINLRGLLLAGIILGLLGTLDDVTVTQAGIVFSLKKNKKELDPKKLYREAMEIGQDHISSMVNTLVLVYTGASLPLLLLFINNPHPFEFVLSQEIVVEEIVRTLVSSLGLILAAPLTTFLAVMAANWSQIKGKLLIK